MGRTVGIGVQDFSKVREENLFYIDKTAFIKEWWESGDDVTLITRPRRFGKTMTMSMLEQFFSVEYAERKNLFEGLTIWQEKKYRELQGTYPVISISFANVKETTFSSMRETICRILVNLYIKYSFLKDADVLTDADRQYFNRMLSQEMNDSELSFALHQLSDYMHRYYKKKVIILLDEYDTPMQEAYLNGYWDDMVAFTRSLFNSTFKTNPYLARGIMTGITRVSKESVFSDLNNLKVVTTTSDEYADVFGFTEEEVFLALEECGLKEQKEEVKRWYDGFIFGSHADIYNPWSILNFLSTGKYGAYWANTSSNRLIGKLLRQSGKDTKIRFEKLLDGQNILCPIEEQIVYDQLDYNENAVFSLLVASGYLKVVSKEAENEIEENHLPLYTLAITNYEVKRMFFAMIHDWFAQTEGEYGEFVNALLKGDIESMNAYMNDITFEVFSYFDTEKKSARGASERFYHGFVLGLIAELRDKYLITSNRESGLGRYDVVIEPKEKDKNAVILEFKVYNPNREKTLQETVAAAHQQIEEKRYDTMLLAKGIPPEHIFKYGIAFEGKQVLIG